MKTTLVIILACIFVSSCHTIRHTYKKDMTYEIATVNNNVCKKLKGDVVLYAIFVDSEPTNPWTSYDINSTLDSINISVDWLQEQARKRNIPLDINVQYHKNKDMIPIVGKFKNKTLASTLFAQNGVKNINKWADRIAKIASESLGPDTSEITNTKLKPRNREKLIARLRDIYKTDNVVLVYLINNYYKDEMSVALHTAFTDDVEYAIVSFKNPPVFAHEFLHLFGALDLYISPFDKKKRIRKQKEFAMKEFPNEIMAFTYRKIDELDISVFSEYLIGWRKEMDDKYKDMLVGKKIQIAKY